MAAYSELNSDNGEITHDRASVQAQNQEGTCSADAASDVPDHLILASHSTPRDGLRRKGRALLKPLIAITTAQYVIVTALAGLAAVAVASETAKIINAKIEPIIAALKRF